jgi:hypothetical protein
MILAMNMMMYLKGCFTVEGDDRGPALTITLTKDGAGLGFSLEGGKDSPLGDKPLTIKKIFTGKTCTFCIISE